MSRDIGFSLPIRLCEKKITFNFEPDDVAANYEVMNRTQISRARPGLVQVLPP
jgi:hypothetical protein